MRSLACLALALLLQACTSRGPCVGAVCVCENGPDCDYVCGAANCDVTCQSLSNCTGACGDGCLTTCHDTSTCDHACGDLCTVQCGRVSTCRVDCGEGCAVDCSDLSTCDVLMVSGEVACERVSGCDVACLLPDGTTIEAEDCGGGRFACPSC